MGSEGTIGGEGSEATASNAHRSGAGAVAAGRRRFGLLDGILLATLGPLALLCLGQHVDAVASGTLRFHAFYVTPAPTASEAPTVAGFLSEYPNEGELRVGDRLLRIDGVDVRGANGLRVSALTLGRAEDGVVAMEIEREGSRQTVAFQLVQLRVPWFRIPMLVGFAVVAIVVLIRSPGTGSTRLMFVAFMNLVIFQSIFTGPSTLEFHAGAFFFHVWGVIALISLGFWVIRFPPDLDPDDRVHWSIALLPGLWILPRLTQYLGGPLPNHSLSAQFFAVDMAMVFLLLGVLSRNFLHSDAVGRRRIKWVLLGAYSSLIPFGFVGLIGAIAPELAGLRVLHAWAVGLVALGPLSVLVAIARFDLFDIDRLISGAASYSLVLVLLALAVEVLLEPFAGLLGERLGFDATSSQIVFASLMAAVVVPVQRAWRPFVDRVFFSDGRSHIEEIEGLLEELPGAAGQGADALLSLVVERLAAVFGPAYCGVHRLEDGRFVPIFAAGDVEAPTPTEQGSAEIARVLGKRVNPMRLDPRGHGRRDPAVAAGVRSALRLHDAAVLVPLRPRGALEAFFCLGPKRSGDVYTATDLTLLASVAHHMAEDLAEEGLP